MDVQTEAVDDAGFEERSPELAAAHDADAAAVLLLEAPHEFAGVFADDCDAFLVLRKRAREDVGRHARVPALLALAPGRLVGLAPHHDGVDGLPEARDHLRHLIAPEQPVPTAVGPGHEVVHAVGAAEGHVAHGALPSGHY